MLEFIKAILYYPILNLLTFVIWLFPDHSAAWAIIAVTLLIRVILISPSRRAAEGQRRVAEMAPLLEELKKEYGDDRQGLANAQMELYKRNNVNPFSSCGILLIQIPILYALYFSIRNGLTVNNPNLYAWLPRPSFINTTFLGINLLKPDPTFILPIIAAVLQYFQLRMMMPKVDPAKPSTDPTQAMTRNMMYISPLLLLVIARTLPSAAALYWVVTTAFTIAQQYQVNKQRLQLTGVSKALLTAEKEHPEHKQDAEKAIKELKVLEQKTEKDGVSVTVRRKK